MSAPGNLRRRHSGRDDWGTPLPVFQALDSEFCFELDVCAGEENAKCRRYLSEDEDALSLHWKGYTCFMNPPYSQVGKWVQKAMEEANRGATVVALLPNNTDTRWFSRKAWRSADEIRLVEGRISFVESEAARLAREAEGRKEGGNTGGNIIVVWRPHWQFRHGPPRVSTWTWKREEEEEQGDAA